jgi:hypothetical protein
MMNNAIEFFGRPFSAIFRDVARLGCAPGLQWTGNSGTAQMSSRIEPRRITLAEQWAKLTAIIKGAASRAEEATRCHSAAALQLDLAQYGLTTLVDELSAVMDMQGRRRRATVHILGVTPPRPVADAIAA